MAGTDVSQGQGFRFLGVLVDLDNTLYDFGTAKEEACRQVVNAVGTGTVDDLIRAFLFSPYGVESPKLFRPFLPRKELPIQMCSSSQ